MISSSSSGGRRTSPESERPIERPEQIELCPSGNVALQPPGPSSSDSSEAESERGSQRVRPRFRQNRQQRVLQDFLFTESLLAATLAEGAGSDRELEVLLTEKLPQNSRETRERYAQSILRWFFADGPHGFVSQVWRAYRDESIQRDILRVLYLQAEPIVGECVAQALYPLAEGMSVPSKFFDGFLAQRLASHAPWNYLHDLQHYGIKMSSGNPLIV